MNEKKKPSKNSFYFIKIIIKVIFSIIAFAFIQIINTTNVKNEKNVNSEMVVEKVSLTEKEKETKNNFYQKINLAEYNMINIIEYDYSNFNSLEMFNYFKTKFFNITHLNYIYSEKFEKVKLVFDIGIYDKDKILIEPSDFSLYGHFTTLCYLDIESKDIIYSLPQIVKNKYYECVEYFDLNEKVKFGIYFYRQRMRSFLSLDFNFSKFINLDNINYSNDDIFDKDFVETKYEIILRRANDPKNGNKYSLKKYYMKPPICDLKRNAIGNYKGWVFKNIYNNYFCYCIGGYCTKGEIPQKCKFNFYKNIIDNNKNLYLKTEYIFIDFIFKLLPSDDTFLVFDEMIKRNMSAHYITEKKEIYKEYCNDKKNCQIIIPINHFTYHKYGDFLEKYLSLILKLKAVISCKESSVHHLSYLFYRIDYITYIAVGHGVDYFKDYLFNNYRIYGSKINNKILIPPSPVLVDFPIKHGWPEEDIIKINLPRWDRYSNVDYYFPGNITNNSILVMFTWRFTKWWYGYSDLSALYHENIINILGNKKLNKVLRKKNITLYFSLHRFVNRKYLKKYNEVIKNNKNVKYLKQNQLSECLAKTNLVLSDFSSVIFDLMSRGKPFLIYVPDSEEKKLKSIYTKDYVKLINDMKNDVIKFKNKCITIEETIDRIIKYINNDYKLEPDLKKFYDSFNFKIENNTNEFIEYLINLD